MNKANLADSLKSPPSLLVLALGLLITLAATFYVGAIQKHENQMRLEMEVSEVQAKIRGRIEQYENALLQARAFIQSRGSITREQFKEYIANTEILERYPGIQGLGYTVRVPADRLHAHESEIRATDLKDYKVWPKAPARDEYFSILYLEPFDWRNKRAIGFDMSSEPVRHEAMTKARDTGNPTITGKVTLVQETDKDPQPGFLIYVPMYQQNGKHPSVEERRKSLIGFLYAPFRSHDLISAIFKTDRLAPDFAIFDSATPSKNSLVYIHNGKFHAFTPETLDHVHAMHELTLAGHTYFIALTPTRLHGLSLPVAIGLFGTLVTALLWWNVSATKAAAKELQKERAKYEAVFENSPAAVAVLRGEQHRFEMTNQAYRELISNRDVLGKTLRQALPELEGQPFFELLDSVFRTGKTVSLKDVPIRLQGADGKMQERFVDFVYQRIQEHGRPYGIIAQAIDTTDELLALRAIQENEAKVKTFMEAMPQMAFIADAKGNVTYYNKRHYTYFGLDPKSQEGWKWQNQPMHHPDDLPRTIARWTHSIQTGEPYEIEYRLRRHDGAYRWHLARAVANRGADGKITEWFGTNTDIHDQKEAMEKAKESEARLKFALQAGEMGTWSINLKTNEVLLSEESYRIFGLSTHAPHVDQITNAVVHPDDRAKAKRNLERAIARQSIYRSEYRIIRQTDGEHRWLLSTGGARVDKTGSADIISGVVIDITKRKQAEIQLAEKSAFLQTVLEQMPVGAFFAEAPSGRILFTNKKYKEIWRNPPSTTQTIKDYRDYIGFHPDGRPYEPNEWPLVRAVTHGELVMGEDTDVVLFDGTRAVLRLSAAPIRNPEGDIIAGVLLVEDVTDQTAFQRQLAASLQARDEFLSIASHELKTPLTSLKLQSQIFQRKAKKNDPKIYEKSAVDEMADQIEKQVSRLTRLVDDMLDIARIRSGKLVIEKEEFNLCEMMRDVLERMRSHFTAASYELPKIDDCERCIGLWDKLRLEQVAVNLLTNAIRYGRGKPIHIAVQSFDDRVRLSVTDQGIGIAKANHEKIFDRFERAVNASEVSGLGLGLFITKQIVLAHGGKIWVESEQDKGSTFKVELPRNQNGPPNKETEDGM